MSADAISVTGPAPAFRVDMTPTRRSVLSGDPVAFTVTGSHNGAVYDPRSGIAEAAFLPAWGDPQSGDWHPCTWDVTTTRQYRALIDPGAGGLALTIGQYYAWFRLTDLTVFAAPLVRNTGKLIIE